MIRVYVLLGALAALMAWGGWLYLSGDRNARDRAERDALKSTLESGERFNEGADNPDGTGWYDWLFPGAATAD